MRNITILLFLVVFVSCASNSPKTTTFVLGYKDFGPPVIASDLLGIEWWQWQSHGDSRPKKYDIKVVVYKNTELVEIEKRYPVVPSKNQDYRYVDYYDALKYLDEQITNNLIEKVTTELNNTNNKIIKYMGDE